MLYAQKTTERDYLLKAIRKLLEETKDVDLLELILAMLMKSIN